MKISSACLYAYAYMTPGTMLFLFPTLSPNFSLYQARLDLALGPKLQIVQTTNDHPDSLPSKIAYPIHSTVSPA